MVNLDDLSLIEIAQQGETTAENILVKRYQNLVEAISRAYFFAGGDKDDVFQVGNIGLIRAIRKFDVKKNISFRTFASHCIKNSIYDSVRNSQTQKNIPLNSSLSLTTKDNEEVLEMSNAEQSPEDLFIAKEATTAFFNALSQIIGETDLEIMKLYIAAIPYKEISEKLGVTSKKVDNSIYLTKKKISKLLKNNSFISS